MRIGYLCDHPQHLPGLARAHVAAFGALLPDWTVEQALDELARHDRQQVIPTTLVALEADALLGSVSLLCEDHEHIRQYSPWLATLYVQPSARHRGIGAALVARCVEEAAALGVERLYLYCTGALVAYYRRLGWREHDLIRLGPLQVMVMAIEPTRSFSA